MQLDCSAISKGFAGMPEVDIHPASVAVDNYYHCDAWFDQGNGIRLHILRNGDKFILTMFSEGSILGTSALPTVSVDIGALKTAVREEEIAKTGFIRLKGKKYKIYNLRILQKLLA